MGLFVTSDDLKKRVRMSKSQDVEALAVFDEAERAVASDFYQRLGLTRTNAIIGYTSVNPPTTAEQVKRLQAETAETLLIKAYLLNRLPSFFLDASSSSRSNWNDNGASRKQEDDLQAQIASLKSQANLLLGGLVEDTLAVSGDDIDISNVALGGDYQDDNKLFNSIGRELEDGYFW